MIDFQKLFIVIIDHPAKLIYYIMIVIDYIRIIKNPQQHYKILNCHLFQKYFKKYIIAVQKKFSYYVFFFFLKLFFSQFISIAKCIGMYTFLLLYISTYVNKTKQKIDGMYESSRITYVFFFFRNDSF